MANSLKIRSLNINGMQCKKKRDLVFHEVTKYNNEIILLQETHTSVLDERHYKLKWGPNVYFSHGTTNSRGICTIVPKNLNATSKVLYSDLEGRLLIIQLIMDGTEYIVCNIYAPVSSSENDQILLLQQMSTQLAEYKDNNLILGGDWNVVLDPNIDKKSKRSTVCTNIRYRNMLVSFLEEYGLIDCWRLTHPNMKKFTCRSGKKGEGVTQTRIDMIFLSECLLNILTEAKIEAGFKSDHNFVTAKLKLSNCKRGKGFWKFNNKLLSDQIYVGMIKTMLNDEIKINEHYVDKGFLWDYLKMRVRSETMIYSGHLQTLKKEYLYNLTNELNRLDNMYMDNPTDDIWQQLDTSRRELEEINKESLASTIFRSKCEWAEHGEKSSKFFLNLEKHNYENKNISSLQVGTETITDEKKILGEIKIYYENLYSSNTTDHRKLKEILKDVPKLNEVQKHKTKGIITYDECLKSLKSLSNGKTPGLDGITTDFYKFFWIDISTVVLDSINYAFFKNEMSVDQRIGIITLSPKKQKIRSLLKNWRPITLLCVDYKILAKALAMRLHTILPDYIDESQFGYIKDRYIGENIRCLIDLNNMCIKKNQEAFAIQIDFEKAFDSINWDFMFTSLEQMNFDQDFIKWVKILYRNTTSCVINNGHKTEQFNLRRGVHQGCPLSALLFIILVQVLQQMLTNSKNIKGILVKNKEIKVLQMADDTTILTRDIKDVPRILKLLKLFHVISGLKTNIEKTVAYKLGKNQNVILQNNQYGLNWSKPPIKLLGITITDDKNTEKRENFSEKIQGIEVLTRIWCTRNLSMKGKLTIINSLLIPKLIYPCTVLDVSTDIIQTATEHIKTFFWNWKRPKIKIDTIIRKIENGGIKFPCLDCKIKSWKTLWAIRALKYEDSNPLWIKIVDTLLPDELSLCYLLKCHPTMNYLHKYCPDLPEIYKDIICTWSAVNDNIDYCTKDSIKDECIWLNKNISANNNPLYMNHAMSSNLLYVKDLLNDRNEFLNQADLNRRHSTRLNFLDMLKIRLSIPHKWRDILKGETPEIKNEVLLYRKLRRYRNLKSKDIYWLILYKSHDCLSPSNNHIYWKDKYSLTEEDMVKIYTIPYIATKRTNLQSLQYKCNHKIINCNYWLNKIKILDSPKCRFCQEKETVEHYFYSCKVTKQFWKSFLSWWNLANSEMINALYESDIVLGYIKNNIEGKVNIILNCCLLIGKEMIHEQKSCDKQPDIYKYHCKLKDYILTEKVIATNQNKMDKLIDDWGDILYL
jgi:exonuclease III